MGDARRAGRRAVAAGGRGRDDDRAALVGATALAGAALLALRVREEPRRSWAFWGAALIGALPWIATELIAPAAVVALALTRWLRRRQRGLAGFIALEVVLTSGVVYITISDRLFGGLTPHDVARGGATGASGAADHLARAPRLATALGRPRGLVGVVAVLVVVLALRCGGCGARTGSGWRSRCPSRATWRSPPRSWR